MMKSDNRFETVVQDEWSSEAIFQSSNWIRQASKIFFRPTKTIVDDEIAFGELIIHNTNGESFEMGQRLRDKKHAVSEDNPDRFLNIFNRSTSAIIDRWDSNMRDKKILDIPDTLFVTDIGDSLEGEKAKFRQLNEDTRKQQLKTPEDLVEINRSIQKVSEWNLRNEGVVPEIPKEVEDIEKVLNGPLKTPERDVPEDIPLKRIDKNLKESFKESPFANISRISAASSPRAVVMMPAGAQFNSSLKTILVDNNLEEIDPDSIARDSSDDSNGDARQLLPEETQENQKKKNDCCISQ